MNWLSHSKLDRFLGDQRGNIAAIFTFALPPLLILIGLAVDVGRHTTANKALQSAADSAVLSALSSPTSRQGENAARAMFNAQADRMNGVTINAFNVRVWNEGAREYAEVSYDGTVDTAFGSILDRHSLPVAGYAKSVREESTYLDLIFVFDVSSSMGLAATEEGRDKLKYLSRNDKSHRNCMFACHRPAGQDMEGTGFSSKYERAKFHGVETRFDVMIRSLDNALDGIESLELPEGRIRVGIMRASHWLYNHLDPTDDFREVRRRAAAAQFIGGTRFDRVMPELAKRLKTQGTGKTEDDPKKIVVLVTDGVNQPATGSRRIAFDAAWCDHLKNMHVPVAVINTKYVADPTNGTYRHHVAPIHDQLEPNLKACASHTMYFPAEDADEITEAFSKVATLVHDYLRLIG